MNRPGGAKAVTRASRSGSLRNRGLLLAVLVLAISLGIVGAALDRAFTQSSEADLSRQMETWTYLVLGATELDESGALVVEGNLYHQLGSHAAALSTMALSGLLCLPAIAFLLRETANTHLE